MPESREINSEPPLGSYFGLGDIVRGLGGIVFGLGDTGISAFIDAVEQVGKN